MLYDYINWCNKNTVYWVDSIFLYDDEQFYTHNEGAIMEFLWSLLGGCISTLIVVFFYFIAQKRSSMFRQSTQIIDIDKDMKQVNSFIRKQFSLFIHEKMSKNDNSVYSDNRKPTSIFISEIVDPDKLRETITGIASIIIIRMSSQLKALFYKYHAADGDYLTDYVLSWCYISYRNISFRWKDIELAVQRKNRSQNDSIRIDEEAKEIRGYFNTAIEIAVYNEMNVFDFNLQNAIPISHRRGGANNQ